MFSFEYGVHVVISPVLIKSSLISLSTKNYARVFDQKSDNRWPARGWNLYDFGSLHPLLALDISPVSGASPINDISPLPEYGGLESR